MSDGQDATNTTHDTSSEANIRPQKNMSPKMHSASSRKRTMHFGEDQMLVKKRRVCSKYQGRKGSKHIKTRICARDGRNGIGAATEQPVSLSMAPVVPKLKLMGDFLSFLHGDAGAKIWMWSVDGSQIAK